MKRITLILLVLIAGCSAQPAVPQSGWTFAVMGDTPYYDVEEAQLRPMIEDMNKQDLAFIAHVGDIINGDGDCSEQVLRERRALFQSFRHPFVLVPGDNEWTDCHRGGYDPLDRLDLVRQLFSFGDSSLGQRVMKLERQSDLDERHREYSENVRWQMNGVVFVGLNVPGSNNNLGRTPQMDAEYQRRMAANFEWLDEAVKLAEQPERSALVILIQANPDFEQTFRRKPGLPDGYASLRKVLAAHAAWLKKPILFVHGDSHSFQLNRPLIDVATGKPFANFTRVEVDGSPRVNWVRVNVDAAKSGLFTIQRGR